MPAERRSAVLAYLGDIFRRASFPGNEWVAKYFDFCEEIGKTVTLQNYFHPELFPKNGSLRGLKRLSMEQRTQMLADKMIRAWQVAPNPREIEMLLKAGVNTEYIHPQAEGCTLLGYAARRGYVDCVDALLRHGADMGAKAPNTLTPFQQAAYMGQARVMDIMLSRGADLSQRTEIGMTPLMLIVNGLGGPDNRRSALELLLARGVSIEDKDNEGRTAMDWFNCNRWTFQSMGWKETWAEPLLKIVKEAEDSKRRQEATQRLIKTIRNIGTPGGGAPDPKALQRYIDDGADIEHVDDFWGDTALGIAAGYNMKETCEILLNAGANLFFRDKRGSTPFMSTAVNGYEELMKIFIARGADVNERDAKGETGIIQATHRGCRTGVIKIMLEHGAEVNVGDETGKTAFDYCEDGKKDDRYYSPRGNGMEVYTELGQILCAGAHRRLLEKATDGNFATPGLEMIKKLAGDNIHMKDAHGWTPFLWAAHQGDIEAMKLLLDKGANLQATENTGKNALMLAVYPELHVEAARFLMDRGIFADLQDQQRRSALDWAKAVIGDKNGKTLGRPKAEALKEFQSAYEPVMKSQSLDQYHSGLRAPVTLSRRLRFKGPE
ncbi:MAG: ankyrin repeat domain-containing protein [Alphaproteobacteria bacterium]|nr:MAG: ankyrin repeat domain-containing protein [Alphaproteobacteria bacterium]